MEGNEIRLAHLSDVHVTVPRLPWRLRDWLSKRLTGWLNLAWFGRQHRFSESDRVLAAAVADIQVRRPDHVVFSGDAVCLGFEPEFRHAAQLMHVGEAAMPPGLAVPGNHDYYTRQSAAAGWFERYFAPWQTGERLDEAVYPFAQRLGPVWLVAVNSCTGNRWFWDASGQVGPAQAERLKQLLSRLEGGPRILVTHYPVCLDDGRRESAHHGLRDLEAVVAVAAAGGVSLWLHGHRHHPYLINDPTRVPFPVICAGSATERGRWCYHEYTIAPPRLVALRRVYSPAEGRFTDGQRFEVALPQSHST
jgi:3',5'-cyclic AMP phosphodiesterase CpdA